jgi:hypothetical protein
MPAVTLQLLVLYTRFREMRIVIVGCLGLALVLLPPRSAPAQARARKDAQTPAASPKDDQDNTDQAKAKNGVEKGKAGQGSGGPEDEDGTSKALPYDVFRDSNVEKLLGITSFPHIKKPTVSQLEIQELNGMAGPGGQPESNKINRVVDAMVSELTDHANIQAVVDPSPKTNPTAEVNKAINNATTTLLEPIFLARTNKNQAFLTTYNRILKAKLPPLLKNHLIPRVQAMIVLGQAASADFFPIYVEQIKDQNQTVWVKLWAFEGIANAIEEGARPAGDTIASTAKVVADFLAGSEGVPYPVQLRALEALSALKQGCEPTRPEKAAMASAAMRFLADGDAKLELRSEAARALGLMQIPANVRKYNYSLVAHSVGVLAADLGEQINSLIPEHQLKSAAGKAVTAPDAVKTKPVAKVPAKPALKALKAKAALAAAPAPKDAPRPHSTNPIKARYLTALLIGPVYQAFEGVPGVRGDTGGLVHNGGADASAYSQKVFDLVKPVARASIDLITSGSRQINDRKKDLQASVDALREFLEKNAPGDRHLVQGGEDFPLAQALGR